MAVLCFSFPSKQVNDDLLRQLKSSQQSQQTQLGQFELDLTAHQQKLEEKEDECHQLQQHVHTLQDGLKEETASRCGAEARGEELTEKVTRLQSLLEASESQFTKENEEAQEAVRGLQAKLAEALDSSASEKKVALMTVTGVSLFSSAQRTLW